MKLNDIAIYQSQPLRSIQFKQNSIYNYAHSLINDSYYVFKKIDNQNIPKSVRLLPRSRRILIYFDDSIKPMLHYKYEEKGLRVFRKKPFQLKEYISTKRIINNYVYWR